MEAALQERAIAAIREAELKATLSCTEYKRGEITVDYELAAKTLS